MSDDGFDSSRPFDVREWLSLLSYEKIHALQYGFVIMLLAAWASSPTVLAAFVAVSLWAVGIRSSPYRFTSSGEKKRKVVEEDGEMVEEDADGVKLKFPKQVLKEIRNKVHYFWFGGLVGDRAGYFTHVMLYETEPDHYAQLPEIVRLLVGF